MIMHFSYNVAIQEEGCGFHSETPNVLLIIEDHYEVSKG